MSTLAWWFAAGDRLPHGDNRLIVIGESHKIDPPLVLCEHALHGSRHPFDALQYAPGPWLYRVEFPGEIVEESDKLGGLERKYLAKRDMTQALWRYARGEALAVAHLWDIDKYPPCRAYLETGDESLRAAAWAAAWAARAAGAAAWAARAAGAAAWAAGAARDRFLAIVEAEFE